MKPTIVWILCGLAIALVPAAQAAEDLEPAQLKEFSFTPNSVDVTGAAATVVVTARITDNLAGFRNANFGFSSPSGSQGLYGWFLVPPQSGNGNDGVYLFALTIPRFAEAGTWKVRFVELYDQIGNYASLGFDQLVAAGFPATLDVVSQQDTDAPVLAGFSFTPNAVDVSATAATLNFTAHFTDALAGFRNANFGFSSPSSSQGAYGWFGPPPMTGDVNDGEYTFTLTIPAFAEAGTWTIRFVEAYDQVGNYMSLGRDWLQAVGFPTAIEVTSTPDTTPPVFASFTVTPGAVDTSAGPGSLTITAHVTDDLSGFRNCNFGFSSASGSQSVYGWFLPPPQQGGANDGTYSFNLTVPAFAETGTWTLRFIEAYDQVGNYMSLGAQQADALGFSTTFLNRKPSIALTIDIKPGGFPNSINPKSKGTIPVAISSDATFDAPNSIDTTTLTFGRTGTEASLAFCNRGGEDVNGDGRLDLVCHFDTRKTGFQSGDTTGILKGKTLDGIEIAGSDAVRIVP